MFLAKLAESMSCGQRLIGSPFVRATYTESSAQAEILVSSSSQLVFLINSLMPISCSSLWATVNVSQSRTNSTIHKISTVIPRARCVSNLCLLLYVGGDSLSKRLKLSCRSRFKELPTQNQRSIEHHAQEEFRLLDDGQRKFGLCVTEKPLEIRLGNRSNPVLITHIQSIHSPDAFSILGFTYGFMSLICHGQ